MNSIVTRLAHLWSMLHGPGADAPPRGARSVDPASLREAREAIRSGDFDRARVLLSDWDGTTWIDAACLNVLGVLAVASSNWKQAARLWRLALRADPGYQPARQNLRRYFELFQFGYSQVKFALGDEPELLTQSTGIGHDA